MSDMTNKLGLPTVEQVTRHAEQYQVKQWMAGRWLYTTDSGDAGLVALGVIDGRIVVIGQDGQPRWCNDLPGATWNPCDQQGTPVGLVEERDVLAIRVENLRATLKGRTTNMRRWRKWCVAEQARADAAIARAEKAEAALARKTEVLDDANRRIAELGIKIGGLESEIAEARAALPGKYRDASCPVSNGILKFANETATETDRLESELASVRQDREEWEDTYHSVASERDALAEAIQEMRDARVCFWPRIAQLLELPEDAPASDVVAAVERYLGDPNTPEGKALRALVIGAREPVWSAARMTSDPQTTVNSVIAAMRAIQDGRDIVVAAGHAAAWLAVLLERCAQSATTPGDAIDACAAAPEQDEPEWEDTGSVRPYQHRHVVRVAIKNDEPGSEVKTCVECARYTADRHIGKYAENGQCAVGARVFGGNAPPADCPGPEPRDP